MLLNRENEIFQPIDTQGLGASEEGLHDRWGTVLCSHHVRRSRLFSFLALTAMAVLWCAVLGLFLYDRGRVRMLLTSLGYDFQHKRKVKLEHEIPYSTLKDGQDNVSAISTWREQFQTVFFSNCLCVHSVDTTLLHEITTINYSNSDKNTTQSFIFTSWSRIKWSN